MAGRTLGLSIICLSFSAPAPAQSRFASDAVIQDAARSFLPRDARVGIVIGLLDEDGSRRIVTVGAPGFDGHTIFEIGSVTKVFSGTLLAEMAERGELRLDEPLSALLPGGVRVPSRSGRAITLLDLATHSSGLPREPDNFRGTAPGIQYADYTVDRLYAFLDRHELSRDPGGRYQYSNLGVGLLGHALALRAKTSLEELLKARILGPLAMTSTAITLTDPLNARLAPSRTMEMGVLAGAGALKASGHDVLTFLAANLRPPDTPLGRAIRLAQQPHFSRDAVRQVGLAWDIDRVFGERVIRHGGETLGYRCFVGFNADRQIAAVALINSRTDLGQMLTHLIAPHVPLWSRNQSRAFSLVVLALAGLLVMSIEVTSRSDLRRRRLVGYTTMVVVFGWILFLQSRAPSADTVAPFGTPVRLLLIGAPLLAFVVAGWARVGAQLSEVPLPFLIGVQSFRAILALILQRTYAHSAVPLSPLLDWHVEAVFGVLSLALALLVATRGVGVHVVKAWNWVGGTLLLHLVAIAWVNPWATQTSLTALPAFIVPVALLGHMVVFRKTRLPGVDGAAPGRTATVLTSPSTHRWSRGKGSDAEKSRMLRSGLQR